MTKKHKTICRILNYAKHLLISASTVPECVSIFAISSLVGILVGVASFTIAI